MDEELRKAALAKHARWDVVRERLRAEPGYDIPRPFCGHLSVKAAWAVFHVDPRTASMDLWCEQCGERTHGAAILPDTAPDLYPSGQRMLEADVLKRLFTVGRERGWRWA